MQLESRKRLTVQERTYRALTDIAKAARHSEVDESMVTDAVLNWTIDPVSKEEDGTLKAETEESEDLTTLFSYVINHLNAQLQVEDALGMARELTRRMQEAEVDPARLSEKDQEEWNKVGRILDTSTAPGLEIPDTLDELLAAAGEDAIKEGTAEEVGRAALIHKVNSQAKAAQLLGFFLNAVNNGEDDVVHGIIHQYGCVLVHILTSLLLSWVDSRSVLPEELTLEQWFKDLGEMGQRAESLSEEEKIELGQHYLEHEEGDED